METMILPRPAEHAENQIIDAILSGEFPIDSNLPAERELAARLGVTRPTLREALQRLARDGWLEIRQGKSTRVRDYWREGNLGVLGALGSHPASLPADFIPNLLGVRQALAPAYARLAVEQQAPQLAALMLSYTQIVETPGAYAAFDWRLHQQLVRLSGNPIFTLILNGFAGLYEPLACRYFETPANRRASRDFYSALLAAAQAGDADQAEQVTRAAMQESSQLWSHR